MIAVRIVAAVLGAAAAVAAVLGFAVAGSPTPAEMAGQLTQATQTPAIQQEIESELRRQVLAAGDRLAAQAGPLGGLTQSAAQALADQAAAAVPTPRFQEAWRQWVELLYGGMLATATGTPDPQVVVSGDQVTVAILPLLTPLAGDTVAGGAVSGLEMLGQQPTVTVVAPFNVQRGLTLAGALAQWRWLLVAAAVALILVTAFAGTRRLLWAAVPLVLAALGCAAAAVGLEALGAKSPASSPVPLLSQAVIATVTAPWTRTVWSAAAAFAVVGLVLAVAGGFSARTRRA